LVSDLRTVLRVAQRRKNNPSAAIFDSRTLQLSYERLPHSLARLHLLAFVMLMLHRFVHLMTLRL